MENTEQCAPATRAVIVGGLAVLGAGVALLLAFVLRELLAVLFLGLVVGVTLGPAVDGLARYRVPRILSGLVIYAIIATLVTAFFWYAIPELADEVRGLAGELDEFERRYDEVAEGSRLPSVDELQPFLEERLGGLGAQLASRAFLVFTVVLYTLTIFAVGLFVTVSREPARELFLSLLEPRHRERAAEVLGVISFRLRRYVLGEFVGMTVVGVITFAGLSLIGMPFAFGLAALAFLFEILPILGPWLAFAPALLIALTEGPVTVALVIVLYLALQQLESYVIVPLVHRRGTHMPELLILIAVLVGGALMGVLGALVAIPLGLILHTLFMELFVPWRRRKVGFEAETDEAEPGRGSTQDMPSSS